MTTSPLDKAKHPADYAMVVTALATIALVGAYAAGRTHLPACLISGGLFAVSLASKFALYQKRDPSLGMNVWRYRWKADLFSNALMMVGLIAMVTATFMLMR